MPSDGTPQLVLSDAPTSEDSFGSHTRVAEAVVALIRSESPEGRSIALTGAWGSGKSSVIEIARKRLDSLRKTGKFQPSVFLFDAWIYQGDPLRRSFLEALIDFTQAIDPDEAKKQEWRAELDRITGRSESSVSKAERPLTGWGLAVAISLVFCPALGGALMGKYDGSKYAFSQSPFALLATVAFSLPPLLALVAFLFDRQANTLKALLLREARQDTTTTTVKTREPSSTDFRNLFQRIAGDYLSSPERRLIVVIDNLDRIDAAAAVSMWATMRVFFDLQERSTTWGQRLWLIVPFDRSALHKLWSSETPSGDSELLIDSFLNKTFQISFHVSPPVLKTWKAYCEDQLKRIFTDARYDEARAAVYRVYSLLGSGAPSPRELKIFVNGLSAIHLQWATISNEDRLDLPFIASYLLVKNKLAEHGLKLLDPEFLPSDVVSVLTRYDPSIDAREAIAALHFNVPRSEALQVLIGPQILSAITSGDFGKLDKVQQSSYFWDVFDRVAIDQYAEWKASPDLLLKVVRFLEQTPIPKPAESVVAGIWRHVIGTAADVEKWTVVDAEDVAGIKRMLPRIVASTDFESIGGNLLMQFQEYRRSVDNEQKPTQDLLDDSRFQPWLEVIFDLFATSEKNDHLKGFVTQKSPIHVSTSFFLTAHSGQVEEPVRKSAAKHLRVTDASKLPAVLASWAFTDSLTLYDAELVIDPLLQAASKWFGPAEWSNFASQLDSEKLEISSGMLARVLDSVLRSAVSFDEKREVLTKLLPSAAASALTMDRVEDQALLALPALLLRAEVGRVS